MNTATTETEVVIENATFTYPGGSEPAINDVSLIVDRGTLTLIAGRTGSGKSTLLKILAGWIPRHTSGQFSGRVTIGDHELNDDLPAGIVGYVLQSPDEQICTTSVEAEVAFGLENLCLPGEEIKGRVEQALTLCGLTGLENRHPQLLSGGQKQRLVLAAILAMRPSVLVLDEPLSQLDPLAAHELLGLLARLKHSGLSIVVAEHRLDELLSIADRLVVVDQGAIAANASTKHRSLVERALADIGWRPMNQVEVPAHTSSQNTVAPLVDVRRLSARHRRATSPVWSEVSFVIRPGDRIALLGPNGSGKSTLLQTLAGIMPPEQGAIEINEKDGDADWGLVLQNPDLLLFNTTVAAEIAYALRHRGQEAIQIQEQVEYLAAAFDLSELLAWAPLALSQGQRLRLAVAATCAVNPRVLLLDEPTTGQDPEQVERLMQAVIRQIDSSGRLLGTIFSTHELRIVARYATRVLILAEGNLAADTTVEQFWRDDRLRALAGWPSQRKESQQWELP